MKKSLSILLAIALVFSMFGSLAFADEHELTAQEKFEALVEKGIFTGLTGEDPAGLDQDMTRAQFARIAGLLLGVDVDATPETTTFTDVAATAWYYEEVEAAVAAGLMQGNGDGTFSPDGNITVEQLAIVLANILGLEPVEDAEVEGASSWAAGYVAAILAAGFELPTDYQGNAKRELLVISAYTADEALNPPVPDVTYDVTGVSAIAHNKVEVTFAEDVTAAIAVAANFSAVTGTTALEVTGAEVSGAKTVLLTTAAQTAGSAYTLTISNIMLTSAADATQTFIGAVTDSDAPSAIAAVPSDNKTVVVTFTDASSRLDKASAENVANYTIAGLTVSAASLSGKVVTLTTSAQAVGTVYTASVVGVKDIAGNAITTALTSTFAGVPADTAAPSGVVASTYSNTQVLVTFTDDSKLDQVSAETVANYTIAGLTVSAAMLLTTDDQVATYGGSKNKSVLLTVSAQSVGTVYTVSVLNVADVAGNKVATAITNTFAGKVADTAAPTVLTATPFSNTIVVVNLSDDSTLDSATAQTVANFTINNSLTVSAAQLITTAADAATYGGTIHKSVILTTSAQAVGTVYTVTVNGVKDSAGNAMTTAGTATFAGKAADTAAPSITSVEGLVNNQIKIVFADDSLLDEASVKTLTNYSIAGLGYPISVASYTASTKTLILNTGTQANLVYTVTITGVKDVSGNTIASTAKTFAGVGAAQAALAISSVTALNKKQIQVTFNKALNETPAANQFRIFNVTTGLELSADFSTIAAAVPVHKVNSTTYILTLNNATDLTTNVYRLEVIANASVRDLALTGLVVATTSASQKQFAGVTSSSTTPIVSSVTQVGPRVVEVAFNSEVTVSTFAAAAEVTIQYDAVTINLASTSSFAVQTDKTKVRFTFASDIAGGKVAKFVVDAAGFDDITDITTNYIMALTTGSVNHEKTFGTVAMTAPAAIIVSSVTAVDDMTLEVAFNQDVIFNGGAAVSGAANLDTGFSITTQADGAVAGYSITYAEQTASNKIRVYYSAGANITSGNIYKLKIADDAEGGNIILKANDTAVNLSASTAAQQEGVFGFNTNANTAPSLVSAIALSSTVLQLTFSEGLSALPTTTATAATDIQVFNGSTQIAVANLSAFVDVSAGGLEVFTVTLSNGVFATGTTYTVKLPTTLTITDKYGVKTVSKASASDANLNSVTFGGSGTMAVPTLTGATYDEDTGILVVSGTNYNTNYSLDVTKFVVSGVTLTAASAAGATIDNATTITITIAGADKVAVDTAFASSGVKTNALATTAGWLVDTAINSAPAEAATGNSVTVSNF